MKKKVIVLVSTSIILASTTVYFVHASLAKTKDNTQAFEQYYNDENNNDFSSSNNNSTEELEDNIDTAIHSNADAIDTNPKSITVFVNKEYGLPKDYVPDDLVVPDVLFNISYFDEKKLMRKEAASALEDLFAAAKKDGYDLYAISAYRSYKRQEEIYNNNIINKGIAHTYQYSAKPGFSEHQTGLSIDVSAASVSNALEEVFASSTEGKWLERNCYRFGYIIRYPEEKSDITGYSYEPWHIRYVGKDLATYLYTNNLTLEEYYNYTPSKEFINENSEEHMVDVDPDSYTETISHATPTPSPTPSLSPSPSPSPSPDAEEADDKDKDDSKVTEPDTTKKPTTTKKPQATKTPAPSPTPTLEPTLVPTTTPGGIDDTEDPGDVTPSIEPTTEPSASPIINSDVSNNNN